MIDAVFDSKKFEERLRVFSSSLGGIFKDLLDRVGSQMTSEAQALAPVRTGKLRDSINFLFYEDNRAALTTKKSIKKSNIWYSNMVEFDRNIKPKRKEYLTFRINGEWKKVKSVNVRGQPFMRPVFNDYFGGESGKGYRALAAALEQKMAEELR